MAGDTGKSSVLALQAASRGSRPGPQPHPYATLHPRPEQTSGGGGETLNIPQDPLEPGRVRKTLFQPGFQSEPAKAPLTPRLPGLVQGFLASAPLASWTRQFSVAGTVLCAVEC